MNGTRIGPEALADELNKRLGLYSQTVTDAVNQVTKQTAAELVKRTKAAAPVRTGDFRAHISSRLTKTTPAGETYTWFVRPPDHRLTHLLVHGHQKRGGGRTKADPFLQNALDAVMPTYETNVQEAIRHAHD